MIGCHISASGPAPPMGCLGAVIVLAVVWVMLGLGGLLVWSLMRDVG